MNKSWREICFRIPNHRDQSDNKFHSRYQFGPKPSFSIFNVVWRSSFMDVHKRLACMMCRCFMYYDIKTSFHSHQSTIFLYYLHSHYETLFFIWIIKARATTFMKKLHENKAKQIVHFAKCQCQASIIIS